MIRQIQKELESLKQELIEMAVRVEDSIDIITSGLRTGDLSQIDQVYELETKINLAHQRIDAHCVKLLALQQPMAADLRFIVAVIKINTDLERMGDQVVNIGNSAKRYLLANPIAGFGQEMLDLPQMFSEVRFMVQEALDAFVSGSEELARDVLKRDHSINDLKHKVFRDVLDYLKTKPESLEQGLSLILIARNLERIGDHATNMSEDVIFASSGKDVRHSPR